MRNRNQGVVIKDKDKAKDFPFFDNVCTVCTNDGSPGKPHPAGRRALDINGIA